jgi:hypothetical protein
MLISNRFILKLKRGYFKAIEQPLVYHNPVFPVKGAGTIFIKN